MKNLNYLLLLALSFFIFSCDDDDDVIDINITEKQELVETYADNYLAVKPYPAVTTRLEDFDQEEAYDFQEDFIEELISRGEVQSGFKLGFTGDAPRPFGAPEPVYGTLFQSQKFADGATIDISETFAGGNSGVEMALFMDRDAAYETSDFPLSDTELMSLIRSVAPLAEFPEIAFEEGKMNIDYRDLIAANAGARAYVAGTPVMLADVGISIDSLNVSVFKDGNMISEGITGDALGSQLEALEFLLRKLAEEGEGVKAGQIIATGSLGADLPLEAGTYELVYDEIGSVTYTLVE